MLVGEQVLVVGVGDYCVIVGVEVWVGVEYLFFYFVEYFFQVVVQCLVGVDVVGDYQVFQVGLF